MVGFIQGTRQKEENPYGAALGQGVAGGLSAMLGNMLEEKQYQRNLGRQTEQNKKTWSSLAPYLEQSGIDKNAIKSLSDAGASPELIPHILKQQQSLMKLQNDKNYSRQLYEDLNKTNRQAKNLQESYPEQFLAQNFPRITAETQNLPFYRDFNEKQPIRNVAQTQKDQIREEKPIRVEIPVEEEFVAPNIDRYSKLLNAEVPFGKPEHMLKQAELKQRRIEQLKASEEKQSDPYIKQINKISMGLLEKKNALRSINRALESNDIDGLDGNYLADILGWEPFRNKSGTELLTAAKQFFINDLDKANARPNQFLEKQIRSMSVETGRSKYANMVTSRILESEVDLKQKEVDIYNQLRDFYMDNLGFVPGNIQHEVDKRLRPYNEERQDVLAYEIQDIYDREAEDEGKLNVLKKVKKGTPLTSRKANQFLSKANGDTSKAIKIAEALGYNITSSNIVKKAYKNPEIEE